MLEKTFYKQLLKRSFAMPVKIVFWDGSSVQYGQGEPKATITSREKVPVSAVTKNASIALGEAYMDQKIDITGPGTYPLQEVITSAYQQAGSFLRNAKTKEILAETKSRRGAKPSRHSQSLRRRQ